MSADCPRCFSECEPAVLDYQGGRIAWWCENCSVLYPDGDYVKVAERPLGMLHD